MGTTFAFMALTFSKRTNLFALLPQQLNLLYPFSELKIHIYIFILKVCRFIQVIVKLWFYFCAHKIEFDAAV